MSIDNETDIFQNVNPNANSALWNAMIYPILNMTIYGVIWYQGEQNAVYRTAFYNCTFPAMIDGWRKEWHQSSLGKTDTNFPFGFVQVNLLVFQFRQLIYLYKIHRLMHIHYIRSQKKRQLRKTLVILNEH